MSLNMQQTPRRLLWSQVSSRAAYYLTCKLSELLQAVTFGTQRPYPISTSLQSGFQMVQMVSEERDSLEVLQPHAFLAAQL